MNHRVNLYPVILAGGSGTRFWPLSRKAKPKQFLPLASSQPLIADTASRLKGLAPPSRTFVVCGESHQGRVRKALPAIPKQNVLAEPVPRNTAPAIGLAALHVAARDPSGVMIVLPSDHHIGNPVEFRRVLNQAAKAAEGGSLVTLGIKPTRPETGFGYIRVGLPLTGEAKAVEAFVEKPDRATAERYLQSGNYLWNAGIFLFRADKILSALGELMPEQVQALKPVEAALGTRAYSKAVKKAFPRLASISIDYGVMEKAKSIAVVPGDFGWSDVGSFEAIPEVRQKDEAGNAVVGQSLLIDCSGCVVMADRRLVCAVGLTDVVVVDSEDAVLVIPKQKSQDVRKVIEELKRQRRDRYL